MKSWQLQSILKQPVAKLYPLPWRVVPRGGHVRHRDDRFNRLWTAEDRCIVDAAGYEVLGVSEWLRAETGILEFLVAAVNQIHDPNGHEAGFDRPG